MFQNSKYYYFSKYFFLPFGGSLFILSILLIFNFKSCAGEVQEFRAAIIDAEDNFIEGIVEASPPFLKTPYSGTSTVLYYHHTEGEMAEKNKDGSTKKKISIFNQKAAAMPFLLKTKNYYIYFGLFGKDFSLEQDYDFVSPNGSTTQFEKHIYNKDIISIYTEEGNLRFPDSVNKNLFFFRGNKNEWLAFLDIKIKVWMDRITYSIYLLILGITFFFIGIVLRLLLRLNLIK